MTDPVRIDAAAAREPLFGIASTRRIEVDAQRDLPPFTLMARAGEAVARLALALAPHARRIVVFAGPGNNGGDGLVAALRLCEMGKPATVWLIGSDADRPADAARAVALARQAGVQITPMAEAGVDDENGSPPNLIIDALLGIGATRPPEGDIAQAIARIARGAAGGAAVLAVDVPSGLDAGSGRPLGRDCVFAQHTLTMLAAKPGLFTAAGRDHAGIVWLDRLGMDQRDESPDAWLVGRSEMNRPDRIRRHAQHKGSFGDVAVVGGAPGMTGAAWLAAGAAHAAGAGRVFVDLLDEAAGRSAFDPARPELMVRDGWWQSPREIVERTTVVCGCGGGDAVRAVLPRLVAVAFRLVLDADALNAVAADTALQAQVAARAGRDRQTLLTPHPLEAARLLGASVAEVQADRLGAAEALAGRYRATVVLKGSGTVVASPGERPRINATGNASLASAGTGDVLAGWIGGRWLAGTPAIDAATLGVVEHGAAAEPDVPGALRAADLIERLYAQSRTARSRIDPLARR